MTEAMKPNVKHNRVQVRLNDDEYFEAVNEAAQAGVSVSAHMRNVFNKRHERAADQGSSKRPLSPEFAHTLSLILALSWYTDRERFSKNYDNYESQIHELARDIKMSLGFT